MPKKSRVLPDLLCLAVGESFVAATASRRNYAWKRAKRVGVVLKSDEQLAGGWIMTKMSGPVIPRDPILGVGLAERVEANSSTHKRSRTGISELAAELEGVAPCDPYEYNSLPPHILAAVDGVFAHKSPLSARHLLSPYYDASEADAILKRALLEINATRRIHADQRFSDAVNALQPRWDDGKLVVDWCPRYLSRDIVDFIGGELGVDSLYVSIPVLSH